MAIRVAHIGTGNVGRIALDHLISDSRFDLTAVWVSSDAKVGKDAGELAGLDASTGITATNDLDALLATEPECAVYCAMGDNRIPEAVADCRASLRQASTSSALLRACSSTHGASCPTSTSRRWKRLPDRAIRVSSSPAWIPALPTTSFRSRSQARARASSRCAAWRSPTTPPTTGRR